MDTQATVFFRNNGRIKIKVIAGYCTGGTCTLCFIKNGEETLHKFGDDPIDISIDLPKEYDIPIDPGQLPYHTVIIISKYMPGAGHQQIKVAYSFIQGNRQLKIVPINANVIHESTQDTFKRYTHYFDFAAEPAP